MTGKSNGCGTRVSVKACRPLVTFITCSLNLNRFNVSWSHNQIMRNPIIVFGNHCEVIKKFTQK